MKHRIKILSLVCFFLLTISTLHSQGKTRKTTAVIKSNVECELCKSNIEKNISKVKGIRKITADYKTHEIVVVFNARKISIEEIRKNLSDLGYDADSIPANNRMNQLLKHKQLQSN